MSYTRKLVQTRPTTDTSFFYPVSKITDKINQYVSEGKAQAIKSVTSEDNLTNTLSVLFNTTADWTNFEAEDEALEAKGKAKEYCLTNNIDWTIEDIES